MREIEYGLVEGNRRQCIDIKRSARVLVLLGRLSWQLDIRSGGDEETPGPFLRNTESCGVELPDRRCVIPALETPCSHFEERSVLLARALHPGNVLHQEQAWLELQCAAHEPFEEVVPL